MDTLTEIQIADEVATDDTGLMQSCLVLHNDEVNTFEWVIQALVEICRHTHEQAEQCAYLIHYKGRYAVQHGSLDRLCAMHEAMIERGISATIE